MEHNNDEVIDYEIRKVNAILGVPSWNIYALYKDRAVCMNTFYSEVVAKGYVAELKRNKATDIREWNNILTDKEVEECQSYAAKIHWGFSKKTLKAQIRRFERGNTKTKCKVYFLLEDCNYHDVANYLADGDVEGAYRWADTNL